MRSDMRSDTNELDERPTSDLLRELEHERRIASKMLNRRARDGRLSRDDARDLRDAENEILYLVELLESRDVEATEPK